MLENVRGQRSHNMLSVGTLVMSIPMILVFNFKPEHFPEGPIYALLFAWALLSCWVIPPLLICEVVASIRRILQRRQGTWLSGFHWHIIALSSD